MKLMTVDEWANHTEFPALYPSKSGLFRVSGVHLRVVPNHEFSKEEMRAILTRAQAFVEQGWCQGVLAQDARGRPLSPYSRGAVAWDAYGAVERATWYPGAVIRYLRTLLPNRELLTDWNDAPERVQAEVIALFARAVEGLCGG